MSIRSRATYKEEMDQLNKKDDACVFCVSNPELQISEYTYWTWAFADLPYWKYHTLLIPKRHILRFHELSAEESLELGTITQEIEQKYRDTKILGEQSRFGVQLLSFWRSRYWTSKKNTQHLHLHFTPEFEGAWNSILDPEAHTIDPNVFGA